MLPTARKLAFTDVPVIDLEPVWSGDAAARRVVAEQVAEVCGRVGFMYIRNHRIGAHDIDAIFATAADFHNLPLDAKMEVSITKNNHAQGYLHGMTKGNAANLSENLQEAFQIRRPLADDDPGLLAGKPLHGKIPWPSAMPDLKPRMMAYYDKIDALGYEMLALFELSLDLPTDLPAVRADFLTKLGRRDEARAELERAAGLTRNARERKLLMDRAAALDRA